MGDYQRKPNTSCLICETPVYRRPGLRTKRVFCSIACKGIAERKPTPCVVCGAAILAARNAKTCSRSCSNTHRKGIKYKIGRPKSKFIKGRAIRKALFDQRGASCQHCGNDSFTILEVHHIIERKNGGSNNLDNLLILCPNCHVSVHKKVKIRKFDDVEDGLGI